MCFGFIAASVGWTRTLEKRLVAILETWTQTLSFLDAIRIAWLAMPEHVHLLVSEPTAGIGLAPQLSRRFYNHPFARAMRAASTRLAAPSLLMASDK